MVAMLFVCIEVVKTHIDFGPEIGSEARRPDKRIQSRLLVTAIIRVPDWTTAAGRPDGKRSTALSITHNLLAKFNSQVNVGQSHQAAPHDCVAGRPVVLAIEIAAEFGHGQYKVSHVSRRRLPRIAGKLVEDCDFRISVKTASADVWGLVRLIIVNQNTRHATTQKTAIRSLAARPCAAWRLRPCSPTSTPCEKSPTFHRCEYHFTFSMADSTLSTGRSVSSFQQIGFRPFGLPRSQA